MNNYKIPDDVHKQVQNQMTTTTVKVELPSPAADALRAKDMRERADIIQSGYNQLDQDHMTLMAAAKREKKIRSPWKRFKRYMVNLRRRFGTSPDSFTHTETVELPFKFDKIKANLSKLASSTGLTPAQTLQVAALNGWQRADKHPDVSQTLSNQLELLKERMEVREDGEVKPLSEMNTEYSSEDATMQVDN